MTLAICTTSEDLKVRVQEYGALQVLRPHRSLMEIEGGREWLQLICPPAYECRVGIMGLGDLEQGY